MGSLSLLPTHALYLCSFSPFMALSLPPVCLPVCRFSCVPLSHAQVPTPLPSQTHPLWHQISCMFYLLRTCCERITWLSW